MEYLTQFTKFVKTNNGSDTRYTIRQNFYCSLPLKLKRRHTRTCCCLWKLCNDS